MPKSNKRSKKITSTQKITNALQNTKMSALLFVVLFGVIGGAVLLYQTKAATKVSVQVCMVTGSIGRNKGGMRVDASLDGRNLGGQAVSTSGNFSFELDGLDKISNTIVITKGTATKGGQIATITAGPCTSTARPPVVFGCTVSGSIGLNTGNNVAAAYLDTRLLGSGAASLNGNYSFKLQSLNKLSNMIEVLQTYAGTKGGSLGTITAGPCV
jgi:hypothetical protein